MSINKIRVKNFKCFKDIEVDLNPFNILIGANAAGKSNFIEIFQFLKDIADYDLENAISMQGGMGLFQNIRPNENITEIGLDISIDSIMAVNEQTHGIKFKDSKYFIQLKSISESPGFEIVTETLSSSCEYMRRDFDLTSKDVDIFKQFETIQEGEFSLEHQGKKIVPKFKKKPKDFPISEDSIWPSFHTSIDSNQSYIDPYHSLIEFNNVLGPLLPIDGLMSFDFDPKLLKETYPISGKVTLEHDGENLAIVLKEILKKPENRRKLMNYVGELVPFVDHVDIEPLEDRSLLIKFKEIYFHDSDHFLPAGSMSDGTINVIALIIVLYFEKSRWPMGSLTTIEEPERHLHPSLISRLTLMMKEASENKQLIVTTHNPEMVKHSEIDDILLVQRDKDGFSHIERPSENEQVKTFIENDMQLDELFIQNLLEI